MVEVLFIKIAGRGAFGATGKTSPPRSALSEARPKIISIDQHTSVIDDIDHEHRRGLRLRQPHKLHLATYAQREPRSQLGKPTHAWILQNDQHVDV